MQGKMARNANLWAVPSGSPAVRRQWLRSMRWLAPHRARRRVKVGSVTMDQATANAALPCRQMHGASGKARARRGVDRRMLHRLRCRLSVSGRSVPSRRMWSFSVLGGRPARARRASGTGALRSRCAGSSGEQRHCSARWRRAGTWLGPARRSQYGPLNYRTAARTLFLRPYLAHFCSFFRRFFAVLSVLARGIRKVAPKDRVPVP